MVVNAGFFTCRLLTGKSEATGVASEKGGLENPPCES
jgi:hypothetical protein